MLTIFQSISPIPEMSDLADSELVIRARDGDREAFTELARRYHVQIFNTIYALVGDWDEADDLVQETFLKAYRSLSNFQGKSQFYTWLYRIGINHWKDSIRSPKHPRHHTDIWETLEEGEESVEQHIVPETADARVENREFQNMLNRALEELSVDQRATVVLREIDGLSYEDIAQALGCSVGTVKSRLFRARVQLKKLWETRYRDYWEGYS